MQRSQDSYIKWLIQEYCRPVPAPERRLPDWVMPKSKRRPASPYYPLPKRDYDDLELQKMLDLAG